MNAFWLVTLGVPAVVLVVALLVIFYALGEKQKGNLDKDTHYDGILQVLKSNGKLKNAVK